MPQPMLSRSASLVLFLGVLSCGSEEMVAPVGLAMSEPSYSAISAAPVVQVSGHFGIIRDGPPPTFSDELPSPWVNQHVSLVAQMSADGAVSGKAHSLSTLPAGGPHASWSEDVVCLVVEGNVAWVGTIVTHATPGTGVPVGQRYVYRLVDTQPHDEMQRAPHPDCTLKPPVGPLLDAMQGELRIHDRR